MSFGKWRDVWGEFSQAAGIQADFHSERFSDLMAIANDDDAEIGRTFEAVFNRQLRMSEFPFNLYPSDHVGDCQEIAVFVALNSPSFGLKTEHRMSMSKAVQRLVQHLHGGCVNRTKHVLLITSSWNPKALKEWKSTIEKAQLIEFRVLRRIEHGWEEFDGLNL